MTDDAIVDAYREHRAYLYRYAYSLTRDRDDAEDLVQDVMTAMLSARLRTRNVRGYLAQAVHNRAMSLHRRRKVAARHVPDLVAGDTADPAGMVALVVDAERLIARLPPRQRDIVRAYAETGHLPTAALMAGMAIGTAKSYMHRARYAIRKQLEMMP